MRLWRMAVTVVSDRVAWRDSRSCPITRRCRRLTPPARRSAFGFENTDPDKRLGLAAEQLYLQRVPGGLLVLR